MKDGRTARPPLPRYWLDYLLYLLLRLVVCLIQMSTIERCERWSQLLAWCIHRGFAVREKLVRENLQRVFPDWGEERCAATQMEMWRHLLLMVCEIAHAPRKIHRTNWYHFFDIPDRPQMLRVVLERRPKIMVTGHFGNFELAGFVNGLFGLPSTSLARPLDNPFIHRYITDFRSMGGQHFLSKDDSAHQVQRLLEAGGTLGLLADQDAGTRGCWVNFLGHPASCHKALALFTLVNKAPMMVCYNRRVGRPLKFQLVLTGLVDPAYPSDILASVQSLTQWYNDCLEAPIRNFPEQYWWLHRRWRDPPDRLRRESQRASVHRPRLAG